MCEQVLCGYTDDEGAGQLAAYHVTATWPAPGIPGAAVEPQILDQDLTNEDRNARYWENLQTTVGYDPVEGTVEIDASGNVVQYYMDEGFNFVVKPHPVDLHCAFGPNGAPVIPGIPWRRCRRCSTSSRPPAPPAAACWPGCCCW